MHKGINTTADEGQTPIIQHGGGFDGADVAHALRGEGFDASEDGTGRGTPIVPVQHPPEIAGTLKACGGKSGMPNGAEECDRMVPVQQPFSIMPMNSGKDYKARETDVAQPIMAGGPVGGNQGGDVVATQAVAIHSDAIGRDGISKTAGADAVGVVRKRNAGMGIAQDGAMYSLTTGQPHAIAFAQNTRDEVRLFNGDGSIAGALSAEPGMKQTTYVAFTAKDHGGDAVEGISPTLRAGGHTGSHANAGVMPAIAFAHQAGGKQTTLGATDDGTCQTLGAHQTPAIAFKPGSSADARSIGAQEEVACTLEGGGGGNNRQAIAFQERGRADGRSLEHQEGIAYALTAPSGGGRAQERNIASAWGVRRLTPRECERLQGFPDDYTAIPWGKKTAEECPDGPRYKALGNSMAVPVMEWIGERIEAIRKLAEE
jgi:DNA (cytosine-5)-methyltransferase 1